METLSIRNKEIKVKNLGMLVQGEVFPSKVQFINFDASTITEVESLTWVIKYFRTPTDNGFDMLTCNYENGVAYLDWEPSAGFTKEKGKVFIQILGGKATNGFFDVCWQTKAELLILPENLKVNQVSPALQPDWAFRFIEEIEGIKDEAAQSATEADNARIVSVEEQTSTEDSGINVITITYKDGTTKEFSVRNGSKGSKGDKGDDGLTTSVTVNGETFEQTDGNIDLGTVVREHQSLSAYRTSSAQDLIDEGKVDKIDGKGLSTNDYDNTEKGKVASALQPSALTPYRTSANQDIIDATKADVSDVEAIEEKIPSQASSTNQLADKEFVNSSISTETAHYISDDGEPFTSVSDLPTTGVTNNDYAFVTGIDEQGNTYFDRYKASVTGSTVSWAKEYRLNNSSFTAQQWASISSGITSGKVSSYDTHISDTANPHGVTKAQVGLGNVDNTSDVNKPVSTAMQEALNQKADTDDIPTTLAELTGDSTHRTVTDAEKSTWSGKQDSISDLDTIRTNAQAGKTASDTISTYGDIVTHDADEFGTYSKPNTGIPKSDLASDVQLSLGKADMASQELEDWVIDGLEVNSGIADDILNAATSKGAGHIADKLTEQKADVIAQKMSENGADKIAEKISDDGVADIFDRAPSDASAGIFRNAPVELFNLESMDFLPPVSTGIFKTISREASDFVGQKMSSVGAEPVGKAIPIDPYIPELPIVNMIGVEVPASPTANGTKGQMVSDNEYVYICTATNTWCRIRKETW